MDILFRKELSNLRERGVQLSDLTPDEVAELVRATDRLANPFSSVNAELAGIPYMVGDTPMWRLTIGAIVWLEEYARKWWEGRPVAMEWAFVFAMIHGREAGAFRRLTDEQTAFEAVKSTALGMCVTMDEVRGAFDALITASDEPKTRQNPIEGTDWESVIVRLEAQTGIPADVWCWDRSADYALRAYHDLQRFADAQRGVRTPRMKDEADRAICGLARLRARIVGRVEAGRGREAAP